MMKMLFYSGDGSEVEVAGKQLTDAGIPCKIRQSPSAADGLASKPESPPCAELWIRHDKDRHRALSLCVQLGLGFSKRAPVIDL
jgi:hypothetical protein